MKDASELWEKVDVRGADECWPYVRGYFNAYGYGVARLRGKVVVASRIAWEASTGASPGVACVLHRCDNRVCCNPAHLFLGTRADNMRDMIEKGRYRGGWYRLSDADVARVRSEEFAGMRAQDVARALGVSASLIFKLRAQPHFRANPKWTEIRIQA